MTNKEISDLVLETLHNIYDVREVEVSDIFYDGERKDQKEICIRHKDEYSDSHLNDLLASFTIPMNADADLIKMFVCSVIDTDLLEDKYNN